LKLAGAIITAFLAGAGGAAVLLRERPMPLGPAAHAREAGISSAAAPPGGRLTLRRVPTASLRRTLQSAIDRGTVTGAVLRVESDFISPAVIALGADLRGRPVQADTVFDLASLTKAVATAPLVLRLVAEGRFTLETPIRRWFPKMREDMAEVSVGQLLLHSSGLPPGPSRPLSFPPEASIAVERLRFSPGERFLYSDLGYILLGRILKIESGAPLDRLAEERVFRPCGMSETAFRPPSSWRSRCASTRGEHGEVLTGTVQDPLAQALGGVAGHAGLFSTAGDLARFSRMILEGGTVRGNQVMPAAAIRYLMTPSSVDPRTYRTYGMDALSVYSAPKGDLLLFGSFGHTGYTGSSFWIDPESRTAVILMTAGVTDKTRKDLAELRRSVANLITGAMMLSK
jgi:CubicO group peptidase (beta-lactamase class C family)